jgi:hypothetical protein
MAWVWTQKQEAIKALEAICDGYTQKPSDGYIVVENPKYVADLIHYLENNP